MTVEERAKEVINQYFQELFDSSKQEGINDIMVRVIAQALIKQRERDAKIVLKHNLHPIKSKCCFGMPTSTANRIATAIRKGE